MFDRYDILYIGLVILNEVKDLFIVSYEILPPFSRQNDNHCECIINCETPYSHVCIGGYSVLPTANLPALGSFNVGVSIVIRFIHNFHALRLFHIHRFYAFRIALTDYALQFRPYRAFWLGCLFNIHRPHSLCCKVSPFQGFVDDCYI